MNRDPSIVSFTKVSAEVVAGVLGGFVDTLSWRSLVSPRLHTTFSRVAVFPGVGEAGERERGSGRDKVDERGEKS